MGITIIISSNINQWTLLMAMLPVAFSLSCGARSVITLDPQQCSELLLTIAQSCVAMVVLANMEFAWWEAAFTFVLFAAQFVLPPIAGHQAEGWITFAFFFWTVTAVIEMAVHKRPPEVINKFFELWREHVMR